MKTCEHCKLRPIFPAHETLCLRCLRYGLQSGWHEPKEGRTEPAPDSDDLTTRKSERY